MARSKATAATKSSKCGSLKSKHGKVTKATDKKKSAVTKATVTKAAVTKAAVTKAAKILPPAATGPGGPMEIVFSFDTTGSMYGCLAQVRDKIQEMIQRLTADIPAIRFAIMAHGDYCDHAKYVTKWEDFSADVPRLCKFVQEVDRTGGGDADECYELVLRQVHEELSWTAGTQRALVMIGDCNPHEPDYPKNTRRINWRDEIKTLAANDIRIYSVQCTSHGGSDAFYKALAEGTGGHHLNLNNLGNIFDFLMSICYREAGTEFFEAYEKEVRGRDDPLHRDMDQLFGTLRSDDIPDAPDSPSTSSSDPVTPPVTPRKTAKAVGARAIPKKGSVEKSPVTPLNAKRRLHFDSDSEDDTGVSKPIKAVRAEKPAAGGTKSMLKKKKTVGDDDDDVVYSLASRPREEVRGKEFIMHDLAWSGWRVAIVPATDGPDSWCKWRGVGLRRPSLFEGESHRPGLWEVGIQHASGKGRITPVVFRVLPGFSDACRWEKSILVDKHFRDCAGRALLGGYRVMVRRAPLTSTALQKHGAEALHDVKRWLHDVNDYAWLLRLPGGETRARERDVIALKVDDTGSSKEAGDSASSSSGESC